MNKIKLHSILILLFIGVNFCTAQEKITYPFKGLVKVDDGYIIGIEMYENTFDCFITDSDKKRISVKKLNAAVIFIYDDKSEKFEKDLKKGRKDIFTGNMYKEKPINMIGIMIVMNGKQYNAAFPYPQALKDEDKKKTGN